MYNALARFAMNTGVRATREMLVWRKQGEFSQLKTVKKPDVLYNLTFSLVLVSWQMVLRHLFFSFRLIV